MDIGGLLNANEVLQDLRGGEEDLEGERQVLDRIDPFASLTDQAFTKRFRVSKELAHDIIEEVTPLMHAPIRRSGISIEQKVLVALRFLGYGSYQEVTGGNAYVAVSQPTVSRALTEFCNAMGQNAILERWVHFPANMQEMQHLRDRLYARFQVPGVIGFIDCTHVAIVRPPSNDPLHPEHIYVNRKNYHSINVQLICDEDLRIYNVNARFPGSTHDAHIWRESAVSRTIEQIYRQDEENNFFLLGDSGYPLRPWLMTPLEEPPVPDTPADRFNQAVKTARCSIERCNGVLKNRWRCLLKHRTLHYTPTMAGKIINTCVVLHNMCLHYNVPEPAYEDVLNADFGMYVLEQLQEHDVAHAGRVHPDLQAARILQKRIIQTHFPHFQ